MYRCRIYLRKSPGIRILSLPHFCSSPASSATPKRPRLEQNSMTIGRFTPVRTSTCPSFKNDIAMLEGVPPNRSVMMIAPPAETFPTAATTRAMIPSACSCAATSTCSQHSTGPTIISADLRKAVARPACVTRTNPIITAPFQYLGELFVLTATSIADEVPLPLQLQPSGVYRRYNLSKWSGRPCLPVDAPARAYQATGKNNPGTPPSGEYPVYIREQHHPVRNRTLAPAQRTDSVESVHP